MSIDSDITNTEFYTPQDAASESDCSPTTIKRLADELHLPVIRTKGGMRLFTRSQVDRIQQERKRRSTDPWR